MIRKAKAVWHGTGRAGSGQLTSDSGVLEGTPYSFKTRFENEKGTNPEELIAAAHAACFTMALSAELGKSNVVAETLQTTATVTLDRVDSSWTVTESHLEVSGKVPGASADAFQKAAEAAETGCPISRLLSARITMEAKLQS